MSNKGKGAAQKLSGAEGFETYYAALFGNRWQALKSALGGEVQYVSLSHRGAEPYFLDPASVCAALCLPVQGAANVLDLCAAPGGKTLILASCMDEDAHLWSNERSPDRKARLVRVIQQSLPEQIASRITASCSDGATWCRRESERYNSILLDAPCSSERHVLADEKYLGEWSPSRIKSLAMEQWALLSSAYRLLASGGYLVYATCALSPQENDDVVSRLFSKFDTAEIVPAERKKQFFSENFLKCRQYLSCSSGAPEDLLPALYEHAEQTTYGHHILPDSSGGAGPLYFALVQKRAGASE